MSQEYQQPTGSAGQQTYAGQQTQSMETMRGGQMGGQSGATGQPGGVHQMTHGRVGHQFESEMTRELNEALESFDRVVEIAEWCADRCIDSGPAMADCARMCKDLADLASMNERLIARDSINGPEIAEAFLRVAEQGLPTLRQHQQSPAVSETIQAVEQAMDATNRLLSSIGRGSMPRQSMGGGQMGGGQMGGGQMGGGQMGRQSFGTSTGRQGPTRQQY